jgi:NTP pyrophosphatase (non-canonical NTP hydrolase)
MNFEEYQNSTEQTAIYPKKTKDGLFYTALGLMGEAGEVAETVKRVIREKGSMADQETKDTLEKELGDVLWYVSQLANELGLSINDIAEKNIKKLMSRKKRDKLKGRGDNR